MEQIVVFLFTLSAFLFLIYITTTTSLEALTSTFSSIKQYIQTKPFDVYITPVDVNGVFTIYNTGVYDMFSVKTLCWNPTNGKYEVLGVTDLITYPGLNAVEYNILNYNSTLLNNNGLNEVNNVKCVLIFKYGAIPFSLRA